MYKENGAVITQLIRGTPQRPLLYGQNMPARIHARSSGCGSKRSKKIRACDREFSQAFFIACECYL